MKVTVCFGNVRVMVPCGCGDILVRELMEKAVSRYRKATGLPADHWVHVHNMKTTSDDGILDPDDLLSDVVDDREQIEASFEEQTQPHNGGDGTSGSSSVGTSSPELIVCFIAHATFIALDPDLDLATQIEASFEEQTQPHNGGDGTSGSSSVGTSSPELSL
ncbi:PREDICTED: partitioning defective 3 homolog, partial [Priapulus caudatus]|uniref:Partitioning defective 3 homolog n=1 Tax=Priapulus caudatus TaxID=37621 RepID=A0ABM1F6S6_PRICU